ncbi:MAG: hypothetical protein QNK23_12230 [Crocinitomicaceae bacterium]|nr:hypothetical protein [Crocinitomicaceae bacterium]
MTREELGTTVQELYTLTHEIKTNLKEKYEWKSNDARFTMFNKIINSLEPVTINFFLLDKYLVKKDWWLENAFYVPDDKDMEGKILQYEYYIGIGLVQNFTYCIESSLRVISREVQPESCNNGTSEFKSIYSSLLKKAELQKHEVLFDLFRNIRNSMHNNAIYFHKSNQDQVIVYRKKEYKFEIGKPCHFATTKLAISLVAEIIVALLDFVESNFIKEFTFIKEEWVSSEVESYCKKHNE